MWCVLFFIFVIECKEGFYGANCSKQCYGNCRDNAACDHVTGQCKGGCEKGWTGILCEKGEKVFCAIFQRRTKGDIFILSFVNTKDTEPALLKHA